ncbi:hypothetical protein EDC18_101454 [Natranaerovirga pectinivora]|uniref:Calcineurin-like phosphoesterase domain-containing protein n=1 Tax=Natranaerovirga pectinivora TaxID=682400 RepID=A0A4R3MV16_9FIRM|nr:metallophosphoesterase [Natranaerovirga pectinivora]TCT17156.1 hypothetical protein EDC18_101454 [Natranaerovirga pectinivora]
MVLRMNKNNTKKAILSILLVFILLIFFFIWQNNSIVITHINYTNIKIPTEFYEYTIVQISDLHNKNFGKNQIKLLNKIKEIGPDIIVVTGDIIDARHTDIDIAMTFIYGGVKIAPIYYVSGNHEARSGVYNTLREQLEDAGVTILDDNALELVLNDSSIQLLGLSDPAFIPFSYMDNPINDVIGRRLNELNSPSENNTFKILLSHRPELLEIYVDNKVDLVFTGHAHGGQFRLPFIGGLFAPNQGFFPKYTSGAHSVEETTMIVSRGLGNSIFPLRIFNRPEIIVVKLNN